MGNCQLGLGTMLTLGPRKSPVISRERSRDQSKNGGSGVCGRRPKVKLPRLTSDDDATIARQIKDPPNETRWI